MKYGKQFLTLVFTFFLIAGTFVVAADAQRRGSNSAGSTNRRPVIVRRYIVRDPFWRSRYYGAWGYYDPYWSSPYLRYQDQKFSLERELRGNISELRKHQEKYRADGYISPKERRELEDDIKDVENSRRELRAFTRRY